MVSKISKLFLDFLRIYNYKEIFNNVIVKPSEYV